MTTDLIRTEIVVVSQVLFLLGCQSSAAPSAPKVSPPTRAATTPSAPRMAAPSDPPDFRGQPRPEPLAVATTTPVQAADQLFAEDNDTVVKPVFYSNEGNHPRLIWDAGYLVEGSGYRAKIEVMRLSNYVWKAVAHRGEWSKVDVIAELERGHYVALEPHVWAEGAAFSDVRWNHTGPGVRVRWDGTRLAVSALEVPTEGRDQPASTRIPSPRPFQATPKHCFLVPMGGGTVIVEFSNSPGDGKTEGLNRNRSYTAQTWDMDY